MVQSCYPDVESGNIYVGLSLIHICWVSVAPEGFKVIVHVGSCCVKASRMLAEHAQKIGA